MQCFIVRRPPSCRCHAPANRPPVDAGALVMHAGTAMAPCRHSPARPLTPNGPSEGQARRTCGMASSWAGGAERKTARTANGLSGEAALASLRGFGKHCNAQPTRPAPAFASHVPTRPYARSSWTNKLIPAKDHGSIQVNIGHLDEEGVYKTGQYTTFALHGTVRATVRTPDAVPREQRTTA